MSHSRERLQLIINKILPGLIKSFWSIKPGEHLQFGDDKYIEHKRTLQRLSQSLRKLYGSPKLDTTELDRKLTELIKTLIDPEFLSYLKENPERAENVVKLLEYLNLAKAEYQETQAERKVESKEEKKDESKAERKVESKEEKKDENQAERKAESKEEKKDENQAERKVESKEEKKDESKAEKTKIPDIEEDSRAEDPITQVRALRAAFQDPEINLQQTIEKLKAFATPIIQKLDKLPVSERLPGEELAILFHCHLATQALPAEMKVPSSSDWEKIGLNLASQGNINEWDLSACADFKLKELQNMCPWRMGMYERAGDRIYRQIIFSQAVKEYDPRKLQRIMEQENKDWPVVLTHVIHSYEALDLKTYQPFLYRVHSVTKDAYLEAFEFVEEQQQKISIKQHDLLSQLKNYPKDHKAEAKFPPLPVPIESLLHIGPPVGEGYEWPRITVSENKEGFYYKILDPPKIKGNDYLHLKEGEKNKARYFGDEVDINADGILQAILSVSEFEPALQIISRVAKKASPELILKDDFDKIKYLKFDTLMHHYNTLTQYMPIIKYFAKLGHKTTLHLLQENYQELAELGVLSPVDEAEFKIYSQTNNLLYTYLSATDREYVSATQFRFDTEIPHFKKKLDECPQEVYDLFFERIAKSDYLRTLMREFIKKPLLEIIKRDHLHKKMTSIQYNRYRQLLNLHKTRSEQQKADHKSPYFGLFPRDSRTKSAIEFDELFAPPTHPESKSPRPGV